MGGGVSRSGVQGSKIYVLCSEPKEHKSFFLGTRLGRPVTGVTGRALCAKVLCAFSAPYPWDSVALVEVSKRPKCPKVLTESAKSHLGPSSRKSRKSLSHRPNPVSHRGKVPKKGFRTVQETVLGVLPWRSENTFRTLAKHFWASWLF